MLRSNIIVDYFYSGIYFNDELRTSPKGKTFQALASQIFFEDPNAGDALKKENIDLLRKVIEKQQTITKVRKVTFFLVIGSGAVGIFNPIVGGVSLVASVGVPLLWSAAQKRKWKALGNVYPGIEYLYSVSKDLSRESTQARLRVHVIVIWLLVAASTATYPRVRV